MIDAIHKATGHSVRAICSALGEPRSSYYHAAKPSDTQRSDQQMGDQIESVFKRHRRRYGHRRIWKTLAQQGTTCAPRRVRCLMAERQLKAIQPKSYVPRTSDGRADKPSPNLLLNAAPPTAVNQAWAGDITHIPIANGWLYLAVVIDLYSRRVVGWSLANHMRADLVVDAFKQALQTRLHGRDLIFHSDRGSQYGSTAFRSLLGRHGIRQSMSARANPYHNAWTESFMGTLKREMLQGGRFEDDQDARIELFDFIESYYNHHRIHGSLGYLTPAQFEAKIESLN